MISDSIDHKGQQGHKRPSELRELEDKNRKAQTVT